MRIIGVIDLRHGRAVHARAGARERYEPVQPAAAPLLEPGDPLALARFYTETLGIPEIYVADLDAIVDGRPQGTLTKVLASTSTALWLDAGIRSVDEARRAVDRGATHVIVGLETLPSFAQLEAVCNAVGRVVFSLDLREGRPVVTAGGTIGADESVEAIARQAVDAGVDTMIAIDLARVGTGTGVDLVLIDRLRAHAPNATLIAGGGIRGWADLERLAGAGCDGALVATALHSAHLTAAEVARARLDLTFDP